MIKIKDFKAYWDAMATRTGASKCVLVRTESEMAQKIKGIVANELFMVVVIPSSDTVSRDNDNIMEKETVIVYALKKVSRKDQTDISMLDDQEQTQNCISTIKYLLLSDAETHDADYHALIKYIDFNRLHTDPEYNYLECDGYSISFALTTTGFLTI